MGGGRAQAPCAIVIYVKGFAFVSMEKQPDRRLDPFWLWTALQTRLSLLLRECGSTPDFPGNFERLARDLQHLCGLDADVGVYVMMQIDLPRYAVAHAMHTAILCELVARRLDWEEPTRVTLVQAALSQNIGMLELQTALTEQMEPPSEAQREEIRTHPTRGVELLRLAGVTDEEWLRAVAEHHETTRGNGYPNGISSPSKLAQLIGLCDVFSAKISPRATRKNIEPDVAARELFLGKGGTENPFVALIVKEVGLYPPGSFVRLANGEIAVVIRRSERLDQPFVFSVSDSDGLPLLRPVRRDTAAKMHTILCAVPRENVMVRIDHARLFGYSRR